MKTHEQILAGLEPIPYCPFLPNPRVNYIENFLKKNNYTWTKNDYSIIVRSNKESKSPKLILMTHLDHPGMVLKNNHKGIFFGSVEPERFKNNLLKEKVPFIIYNPEGTLIGRGYITKIFGKYNEQFSFETEIDVPINSFGQWDIPAFEKKGNKIFVPAADNDLPTAIMLYHLQKHIYSQFDVYYVFNFFEEAHQISSYYLAKNNILDLTKEDLVLNLESKEVDNLPAHKKVKGIDTVTYSGGNVLHVNDSHCLYGYKVNGPNKLGALVQFVCEKNKIPLQFGVIKGSTDARPFTQFALTSHICTISTPNKYKHNVGKNGEIVPEEILAKDFDNFVIIVEKILQTNPNVLNNLDTKSNISLSLKKNDIVTDKKKMAQKYILNERLDLAYRLAIKKKHYYPENTIEYALDMSYKLLSYIKYILLKYLNRST
jgi:putative aminopeptidase FrvX